MLSHGVLERAQDLVSCGRVQDAIESRVMLWASVVKIQVDAHSVTARRRPPIALEFSGQVKRKDENEKEVLVG